MGSTISKEATPPSTAAKEAPKAGVSSAVDPSAATSGCPIQRKKTEDGWHDFIPFEPEHHHPHHPHGPHGPHHPHGPSGIKKKKTLDSHTEYNVYGQKINPDNQMPIQPNQHPAAGQQSPLSTERVNSTIPKVREESYPLSKKVY